MNASEIILEAKSSRFGEKLFEIRVILGYFTVIPRSFGGHSRKMQIGLKPSKSYIENALIFMPSLLPICLGFTIWVIHRIKT